MRLMDLDDLAHSVTLDEFKTRLVGFANNMDFGIAVAGVGHTPTEAPGVLETVGNVPQAYEEIFNSSNNPHHDPVLKLFRKMYVPFSYDEDLYIKAGAADLWEEQSRFGFRSGIAVALHLPGNHHFVLGMNSDRPLVSSEEQLMRQLADVQFLAAHALDAAQRLLTPQSPLAFEVQLTKREREVLLNARAGKSAWITGQLMSISEHTVNFHLRNVQQKLRTANKHHSVRIAERLGLL